VNTINEHQLAQAIDHTLLSPTATSGQIRQLCEQAVQYAFAAVSVNSRWVSLAADILYGTSVKTGAVVSLPLGADSTKIKVTAAKDCIFDGADEIDMVADLAAIVENDQRYLSGQFSAVLRVCRAMKPSVILKVIIESAALTLNQKLFACRIADICAVDFIKTSTGIHPAGGATIEDVRLIKETAPNCKVKASGGIKTAKQAIEFLEAGADRIGTSSGVEIINQLRAGQI
jgi:deoxyribose-phosphate aldolase